MKLPTDTMKQADKVVGDLLDGISAATGHLGALRSALAKAEGDTAHAEAQLFLGALSALQNHAQLLRGYSYEIIKQARGIKR